MHDNGDKRLITISARNSRPFRLFEEKFEENIKFNGSDKREKVYQAKRLLKTGNGRTKKKYFESNFTFEWTSKNRLKPKKFDRSRVFGRSLIGRSRKTKKKSKIDRSQKQKIDRSQENKRTKFNFYRNVIFVVAAERSSTFCGAWNLLIGKKCGKLDPRSGEYQQTLGGPNSVNKSLHFCEMVTSSIERNGPYKMDPYRWTPLEMATFHSE